eukprot:SRR837773.14275.p1 GENE.SRR837773.14275~~SRR837773.14275.p1  ORF type:complete len:397 (-),score=152.88 SRR837773.14275:115-1305(-)
MILGNGSMALFFITRMPPLGVAFAWAFLKALVNVFMVIKILRERRPISLTIEEQDAYEEHFERFGVTARQFKRFWDMGETRVLEGDTLLAEENKKVEIVSLVLSGNVYRTVGGKHIPSLDTFPGARDHFPDGDAGAWVGDLTVLRAMDTVMKEIIVPPVCKEEEAKRVQEVQTWLTDLGLYDGQLDGRAGDKTQHALKRLEARAGLQLEGVVGDQTMRMIENFHLQTSSWTAHAAEGTVIRCWKLSELLTVVKGDEEMRSMLRKAFSQSTIKKLMAMQPSETPTQNPDDIVVEALDDELLGAYEHALEAALERGRALTEDKMFLAQFRRNRGISQQQHAAALERLGWTTDEYDLGALWEKAGDIKGSVAATALRAVPARPSRARREATPELVADGG